jgi:hypothetical protein
MRGGKRREEVEGKEKNYEEDKERKQKRRRIMK